MKADKFFRCYFKKWPQCVCFIVLTKAFICFWLMKIDMIHWMSQLCAQWSKEMFFIIIILLIVLYRLSFIFFLIKFAMY